MMTEERVLISEEGMDLAASIVSSSFLFLLIYSLSATVDINHLKQELRNKFALGTGVTMQFLIMPLLGFTSVSIFKTLGLTQPVGLTLLVLTTSPGGSYSNWWCSTFNADLALSVAMTAFSTVLSIALLPANLFFYSWLVYGVQQGGVLKALDLKAIFISLAIVISAILLGLYSSYKLPQYHSIAHRVGSISGICLILVSIFLSSGEDSANFWSQPWYFYAAVAVPCLFGLLFANFFSHLLRLRRPEQVTIAIECCYQNVGIATSVAVNMFDDPQVRATALAVPLVYGFLEAFIVGIYCIGAWKMGWTKAPRNEKLCVVITQSYQSEFEDTHRDDDDDDDIPPRRGRHDSEEPLTPEEQALFYSSGVTGWRAWLQAPFIPRYPHYFSSSSPADVEAVPTLTPQKEQEDRGRFVSEDYTATTSGTESPPNTPGNAEQESTQRLQLDLSPLPEDDLPCLPEDDLPSLPDDFFMPSY